MDEKRFNPCNTDACKERCDNFGVRCEEICIDEVERLRARVAELEEVKRQYDEWLSNGVYFTEVELAALKASQDKPVAYRLYRKNGYSQPFELFFSVPEWWNPENYPDEEMQPLYTSAPTIPEGWKLTVSEDDERVWLHVSGPVTGLVALSCDNRTMAAKVLREFAKDMLAAAPEYKGKPDWSTQKKWGE